MSKQCPRCNSILPDSAAFCGACGMRFAVQGGTPQGQVPPQTNSRLQECIVDSDERVVTCLRNSYAQSIMSDLEVGSTKVFFTNKRFYAKANRFTLSNGLMTDQLIVDLGEISGTRITHVNPIQYLIFAGIMFLLLVIVGGVTGGGAAVVSGLIFAGIMTISYFLKKGTYLHISYAGDTIVVRVKMYSYNSVVYFLKNLQMYLYANNHQ